MTEAEARALMTLGGFAVEKLWALQNGYSPDYRRDPWWLVKTELGLITIGWRKRVINIDWSETELRKIVTEEDVTKDETMVHAHSWGRAVDYLRELRRLVPKPPEELDA